MTNLLQSIPSPMRIRAELEELVLNDLLGPAGGETEEVTEQSVRDRYLVGMLAPTRQNLSPEEFDELAEGGVGTVEDGSAEYTGPTARTMFPSSFGMTFCIDAEATEFQIIARWGHYARTHSETLTTESGARRLVWKRSQREGVSEPITLKTGKLRWVPDGEFHEVEVQGVIRRRDHFWSVTLFLVNGQDEPKKLRDTAWLFQPELIVQSPEGKPIFHPHSTHREPGKSDPVVYAEERELAMLYRNHVQFGVGHNVSVHAEFGAECPEGVCDRAVRISTRVVPSYEVPKTTPPTISEIPKLAGVALDMKDLGETKTAEFEQKLRPLLVAYKAWIEEREADLATPEMKPHQEAGKAALARCRVALERIEAGLKLICLDGQAAEAFRFANLAMWQQRIRSIYALKRRRGEPADLKEIDVAQNRSWYPFQLAFVLLNLPGITLLDHIDRTGEMEAVADLLWFPTGGGKTEAYLGLSAYTMGLRRLQGEIAGRSGQHGVAVLMRYTLRLLTIQQFQRATALICACEVIRRADPKKWGNEPFRIGLWVGQKTTPNTTDQADEAIQMAHGQGNFKGGRLSGSPAQMTNCPWCGSKIEPGRDIKVESYTKGRCRTLTFCGDVLGRCEFSAKKSPQEGIPLLVVDEEIYRRLPTLLIATVDKFAQMPWNGKVQMLFGQVESYCDRHGFRSPEIEDADSHTKRGNMPAARSKPHSKLRPPDLIIQDELHLISGPLGTMVGLYETALDKLCSWEVNGKTVRPKVIASTATIRKAGDQVYATFLRKVNIFPPQGLDVRDNFFSRQRPPSEDTPGRRYIGICASGRRLKVALIRVYVALLSAAQTLYEKNGYGRDVDPWMTLIGYFNSMRELGGMRRLVDDDVRTRLGKMSQRGLAKRSIYTVDELTSRKDSTDIPETLDHLEVAFDPESEARRKELQKKGAAALKDLPKRPLDVLLATNMVSVGVDVQRLGLMVVGGQPKTTAEYIQSTSRVGRRFPGLVVTVYNWARPRDLSHYESFEHYHATFYKHVEALSVTPFALGAISRGLTALLVSCVRLQGSEFNPNKHAGQIDRNHPYIKEAIETITRRASLVGDGAEVEQLVRGELNERLDQWLAEAQKNVGGRVLGYDDERDGVTVGLLQRPSLDPWDDFTCLNSLRDVEPTVGLIFHDGGLDEDPNFEVAVSEDTNLDSEEAE
ncbi:MAG TPA: DISARM system helicase DrmA [Blastocatellia bacterium]|nr:DISARM system helicase DrmA [Blastocatellia bacterium]